MSFERDVLKTGQKLLIGKSVSSKKKKSRTISENRKTTEGLGSFFKNIGEASAKACKILVNFAVKNRGRALGIGEGVGTAAVSKNPKAALSTTPDVLDFYHTGEGLYHGKFDNKFGFKNVYKNNIPI